MARYASEKTIADVISFEAAEYSCVSAIAMSVTLAVRRVAFCATKLEPTIGDQEKESTRSNGDNIDQYLQSCEDGSPFSQWDVDDKTRLLQGTSPAYGQTNKSFQPQRRRNTPRKPVAWAPLFGNDQSYSIASAISTKIMFNNR